MQRISRSRRARATTGTTASDAALSGAGDREVEADVRRGVDATLAALTSAWDAGDAEAYGALFTDTATYVAFTGTVYRGREDIVRGHAALFAGLLEGTRLGAGQVVSIDVVAPGVVSVVTRGDTYSGDAPPAAASKVQTYVLAERDGRWTVAAFQNTRRKPLTERLQFRLNPGSRPLPRP